MMGASGQDLPALEELRVLSTAVLESTAILILIPQRNRSSEKQPEGVTPSCRVSGFGWSLSRAPSSLSIIHILHLHPSRVNAPPPPELTGRQKNNLEKETQGSVVTPQTVNPIMALWVCLCWNLPYSLIFILLLGTSMAGGDESGPSSSFLL